MSRPVLLHVRDAWWVTPAGGEVRTACGLYLVEEFGYALAREGEAVTCENCRSVMRALPHKYAEENGK